MSVLKSCKFLVQIAVGRDRSISRKSNFSEQIEKIVCFNNLVIIKEVKEVVKKKKSFLKGNIRPKRFYMLPKLQGTGHFNFV